MKALLICGGPMTDVDYIKPYTGGFDVIIAVDAGYKHCQSLKLTPHILIGDFDSIGQKTLAEVQKTGIPIQAFPPKKDKTDTHIAIDYALQKGCTEMRILGALGKRMDHTLSNMSLLMYMAESGCRGELLDEYNRVFYLNREMTFRERQGQTLSVVPITDLEGLFISGVAYPLHDQKVPFASSLCVSNKITEPVAQVKLLSGKAYILLTQD